MGDSFHESFASTRISVIGSAFRQSLDAGSIRDRREASSARIRFSAERFRPGGGETATPAAARIVPRYERVSAAGFDEEGSC
jgi:hypothetical protein